MKTNMTVLIGLLLMVNLPQVQAQASPAPPTNMQTQCANPWPIAAFAGQAAVGTVMFCAHAPFQVATTTSGFQVTADFTAPALTGVGASGITFATSPSGCSIGAVTTTGTSFALVEGVQIGATTFVTMTSDSCTILWQVTVVVAGAVTLYKDYAATYTMANPTSRSDVENRLCDFSIWGASCLKASMNVAITSWPTLIETTTLSGNLALSGTINTVQSGTVHLIIDSWPSLTAAVTNSGTINVVNSGGQNFAVTGSLSVSGAVTVTNTGGQSITVTSWPQLHSVIDAWPTMNVAGTINVVNSGGQTISISSWPSLMAAVTNSGTINVVNSGGQNFAVTGSVSVSGAVTVTNAGGQSITVTSWPQLHSVIDAWPELSAKIRCVDVNLTTVPCMKTGNITNTLTVPNPLTINKPPGFGDSIFLLLLLIAFGLIIAGEMSRDNLYKAIAGVILFVAVAVLMRDSQAIGFAKGSPFLKSVETVLIGLAFYLISHMAIAGRLRSE